jgi:hypothetical protein
MSKMIVYRNEQEINAMGLTKMLLGLDSGLYYYSRLNKDEEDIDIVLAMSIYITSTLIMEQLPDHLAALKKLRILEVLDVDLELMTNVKFWMKNYKLKSDMEAMNDQTLHERGFEISYKGFKPETTWELYQAIERNILDIVEMLTEVQQILNDAPAGLYENFYLSEKAAVDAKPVKARFRKWKRDVGVATPELLKDKEMQELVYLLTQKVMRHVVDISYRESGQVDLEALKQYMVNGFEFPKEFPICYARFRRFVKEGDTLQINYDSYGQYLHEAYYKLTPDEHRALIEFDIMLDLIHQEMAALYEAKLPPALATPEAKELMKKAREAGYLDDKFQPKISNTKSAMLADEIASKLQIRNRWKVFEQFWHRHDMYKDNYDGRDQKQSSEFLDEINKILN